MTNDPGPDARPASYPVGGTFGKLLEWNLDWGTRPKCSTTKQNTPWIYESFAMLVCEGLDPKSAAKSLFNWRKKAAPKRADQQRVDRIFAELFGDDPNLTKWKEDLEQALRRDREAEVEAVRVRQDRRRAKKKPRSIDAPSMPFPTAHFIGRNGEVDALSAALASGASPAILLQGGPGIGKSELTKAIAHHHQVSAHFFGRQWFLALETVTTAHAMSDAVVRAIGGDPALGLQAALETLSGRPSLLVLDNLETPWEPSNERDATEQLLAELSQAPGLCLLASIRGREWVGGPAWSFHFVEALSFSDSLHLFGQIGGKWTLDDPHILDFTQALGGVPLAIKLVAHRAYGRQTLGPLWQEWKRIGADFAERPGLAPNHLTSLAHSIELSLRSKRMTPDALRLLAMLGVLPAGLHPEDRDALVGDKGFDAQECLYRLGISSERFGRIDLLPPIREHVRRAILPPAADAASIRDHFFDVTKRLNAALDSDSSGSAFRRFLTDLPNIEAAFFQAASTGVLQGAIESILPFGKLAAFGLVKSAVFDCVADACERDDDSLGQAHCLKSSGEIALSQADNETAKLKLGNALALYRQVSDLEKEADCMCALGEISLLSAEFDAARSAFIGAAKIYEKVDKKSEVANCYFYTGDIEFRRQNYEAAESMYEKARALFYIFDNKRGLANCKFRLADIALGRLKYDLAFEIYQECLALFQLSANIRGEAACLKGLGDVEQNRCNYEAAKIFYAQAEALYRSRDDNFGMANCIVNQGIIAFETQKLEAARVLLDQARSIYRSVGDMLDVADCTERLGDVERAAANLTLATSRYREALSLYEKIGATEASEACRRKLAGSDEPVEADLSGY